MSTAPTSASIPIQEFRAKLQGAVEARGASYHSIKVFIFRFEDDDTGADKDANTFSGSMHDVFGIEDVEDFAIQKTSKFPGLDVLTRILAEAQQLVGVRSLLIIAYIGHAVVDTESNRLQLISENGRQKLLWNTIHVPLLASTDDFLQNVDVLAVLDCCYAGSSVRAGGNRSDQLLAACDDGSTVRSRNGGVTFTQHFRRAAYTLQNAGNILVSVESLFGELQRSKPPTAPDALHKIIGSARPLVLPLKHRPGSSLGHSESCGNETTVLFKISLAGGPSDVVLSEFQQLLKTIPGEFKVTIENAYESNSVVFLCRTSWETFARLRSTLDCVFVASVKGASLLQGEPQKSSTRSFGDLVGNRQADQVP
ncbi:uncharacterized protein V1513DRAFT_451435 [Lipomyces chichibuensis]|uniref:uncharacterized protein n=1 Tax=Lipomyces chichibuensis TaxID=1546026 RepID=UPI003344063C